MPLVVEVDVFSSRTEHLSDMVECSYGRGGLAYVLKAVPWNESESSHRYLALQEELTYEGLRQPGKWLISHQKSAGVDSALLLPASSMCEIYTKNLFHKKKGQALTLATDMAKTEDTF